MLPAIPPLRLQSSYAPHHHAALVMQVGGASIEEKEQAQAENTAPHAPAHRRPILFPLFSSLMRSNDVVYHECYELRQVIVCEVIVCEAIVCEAIVCEAKIGERAVDAGGAGGAGCVGSSESGGYQTT